MSRTAKWTTGIVLLLFGIGGGYYAWMTREMQVVVAVPENNVEVRVFGIGTVESQVLSKVGFQISGKISSVHADQGDLIKSGSLLATLDSDAQRAKLLKSKAAKRQASANLLKPAETLALARTAIR